MLPILGSMWGTQWEILFGVPERRDDCSRQGINFKKCCATKFGETKIELYVGHMDTEQKHDPEGNCVLRERIFNTSVYWGYKLHIPKGWGGLGLLEIFRGQRNRRENINVEVAAYVTTQAGLNYTSTWVIWGSQCCTAIQTRLPCSVG